jgi:hypothetical protein
MTSNEIPLSSPFGTGISSIKPGGICMKKWSIFAALICAPILLFAGGAWNGNGNMVTSEKPVSAFDSIQISGSVAVNYHTSQEYRAVVTVDSNLEEYVRIETRGGVLTIGTKRGHYRFTNYTVEVYAPSLTGVSISGSVRFEAVDKIAAPSFNLNISGSGKIKGSFENDNFSTRISGSADMDSYIVCGSFRAAIAGSGNIKLSGSANNLDISVSGSGDFAGSEFKANNAVINISGSGRIHIWVLENLKARVSGSGRVRYRGNPKIDYSGSGSGRLESE